MALKKLDRFNKRRKKNELLDDDERHQVVEIVENEEEAHFQLKFLFNGELLRETVTEVSLNLLYKPP